MPLLFYCLCLICVICIILVLLFIVYKIRTQSLVSNINSVKITNKPSIKTSSKQFNIPLVIYQTHESRHVTPNLADKINIVRKHAPECAHYYFDRFERRKFIQKYYPQYLHLYDSLIPGCYQSDLFRVAILYKYGGIYIDSSIYPLNNISLLNDVILPDDKFVAPIDKPSNNGLACGFLASCPNHPYLNAVLQQMVQNIRNQTLFRNHEKGFLMITGPLLYKHVAQTLNYGEFTDGYNANDLRLLNHDHRLLLNSTISNKHKTLYNVRFKEYFKERKLYSHDKPHYSDLWRQQKVFTTKHNIQPTTLICARGLEDQSKINNINIYKHAFLNRPKLLKSPLSKYILINTSDRTFPQDYISNHVMEVLRLFDVLFVQNVDRNKIPIEFRHKVVAVPIGVDLHTIDEKPMWGMPQTPWYTQEQLLINMRNNSLKLNKRIPKVLITWKKSSKISHRHRFAGFKTRPQLWNECNSNSNFSLGIGSRQYTWKQMVSHAFVYSPIGAGYDCHRTWEALILGCIVIAQPNPTLKEFEHVFPIIFHNDPANITSTDLNAWITEYQSASLKQFTIDELFLQKIPTPNFDEFTNNL